VVTNFRRGLHGRRPYMSVSTLQHLRKTWSGPLMGWTLQASEVVGSGPKIRVEIDASAYSGDLSRAQYARVSRGIRGPSLGLAEMQFPAVLRGLLALFSLFLDDILSRSRFFSHHSLTISTQIWTSYETHIFKKSWVRTHQTPRGSTRVLHLINE